MYNVGDKFIIEIESEYGAHSSVNGTDMKKVPNTLYRMKGFNSLVFDKVGLDKLKRYKEGKPNKKKYAAYTWNKTEVSAETLRRCLAEGIIKVLLREKNLVFTEVPDDYGGLTVHAELTVLDTQSGEEEKQE